MSNVYIKVSYKVDVERSISLAEIAYKSGQTRRAIIHARAALNASDDIARCVALRIFIARALSKLGRLDESNRIYRALLNEKNYLKPIIMGLVYNNLRAKRPLKPATLGLVRVFK